MKKIFLTLLVFSFLGTSIYAQNLSSEIGSSKSALNAAAASLDALAAKVQAIRDAANQGFSSRQSAIDATKQKLASTRASIESKNADEPNMMADAWPSRVAAREQLVRDENKVQYDQQVLNIEKASFEHKMKQIEEHIVTTFSKQVTQYNQDYDAKMKAYLGGLN